MNCLIRLLSGAKMSRGKAGGEITINGHRLDKHQLRQRIGFLPTSFDLPPDLTVQQFLTISAMFYPSKTKNYHMDGMIHQYANTFALGPFKDCIFVCSTVLNSLDIYDLAFIINGLRDWAIKSKRIVILAIAPPTIDILNMFSKVDLATYDYLTNEAEAESSMRIGHLISEWQRKAPPPVIRPLDLLPEEVGTANFLQVILALFRRMSYELLNRPYIFIILPLVSNIVSLLISLSFVSLSNDKRAGASERLGLVEALVFYSTIPINTTMILYLYSRRKSASWEFKAHIYGSLPYGVAKTLFDLSFLLISVLLFTLPIYFVTGFDSAPFSLSGLSSFSIVTFLFFFYLYMISLLVAHLFKSALLGTIVSICLNLVSFVVSGLPIHPLDQSLPFDGIRLISPHFWIEYAILQQNFMGTPLPMLSNNQTHELVIGCERTKVLAKKIKEV
ncbi:hypothetical protein WR25_08583 [Diploscapter pachys]|uniref:ABC-2 type transporter transmembrane domain-containing protein n=1 Tax=Diploscapter pachys TaxID=2018661 RepID=A0A2A2JLH7_9BILA|nr:hypothetical protein WR25_08583 [Diploscapter pachys]